ncbi:hypothetical protein [Nocardioides campestrisoli]|uniref:hypothetical protein n=1 Tax=Nocardioides campestrisoli TaxID=2736757 RepID=UPI0015E6EF83|nr:hypothetical protein [Nocardioides campestrisoli]
MASQGSTIFTVGTLLNRAQDQGIPVRVLVEGVWIEGIPVASDGHGVIIDHEVDGQYLVRTTAITAVLYVRPDDEAPEPRPSTTSAEHEQPTREAAREGYAPTARKAVSAGSGVHAG